MKGFVIGGELMLFDFSAPMFWVILAVFFLAIELIGAGALFSVIFAIGSVAASIAAFYIDDVRWLVFIAIVVSIISVFTLKPTLERLLKRSDEERPSAVDAIVGAKGKVIERITEHQRGYVTINQEDWSAATVTGSDIEEGAVVEVERIEGATVFVKLLEKRGE